MEGIRILEVAEHTFVPAASAILADWGAEVLKIEHVERGDAMRGLASTGLAGLDGAVHVLLEHSNRGKQSIGLDLSDPAGLDILYQLAARCDVFLTNKMKGVRERLKIDVDDIRSANPQIIYVRGTGYGNKGPDSDQPGALGCVRQRLDLQLKVGRQSCSRDSGEGGRLSRPKGSSLARLNRHQNV